MQNRAFFFQDKQWLFSKLMQNRHFHMQNRDFDVQNRDLFQEKQGFFQNLGKGRVGNNFNIHPCISPLLLVTHGTTNLTSLLFQPIGSQFIQFKHLRIFRVFIISIKHICKRTGSWGDLYFTIWPVFKFFLYCRHLVHIARPITL